MTDLKLNITKVQAAQLEEYCTAYKLQQLINFYKTITPKNDKVGVSFIKELEKHSESFIKKLEKDRETQKKEGKTMNKDELQTLIQDLQNQLQEAQEKLENLDKYERFKPKEGETYCYVDSNSCISFTTFDSSCVSDYNKYKSYNCFETQEEAQKEANKILIRRKLEDIAKRLNGDKEIDWDNYIQNKFYIDFNKKQGLSVSKVLSWKSQGTVYCVYENFLDIAKEEIGEQELKDYIMGI